MLKNLGLCLLLTFIISAPAKSFEVDPRVKTFLVMNAYGAVGGFLLGSATLAFDAPGRAPFIGASLGLYAGLLFGGYVVVSHHIDQDKKLNPQDYIDEVGDDEGGYGDLPNQMINERVNPLSGRPRDVPLFYLNLIKYSF